MEKTTLKEAKELLESTQAKSIAHTVDRAIGLATLAVAEQIGRVATNLELVATNLQALTVEVTEHRGK